jgi:tetratricopeptide (TPR) repeat protein
MKKCLFSVLTSLLLIGTYANTSLAEISFPGEDRHERYILPFHTNDIQPRSCSYDGHFDSLRLKEILMRRVGADIAEQNYSKAIARLTGLFKAVQVMPNVSVRRDFLLDIFNPYIEYKDSIYDGASVVDLEASGNPAQRKDALVELLVRQALVDPTIPAEWLLGQIEVLNQPLSIGYGVPKAITYIRLSQQYSLLEQRNVPGQARFHQLALAQLKAASRSIEEIRNTPVRVNMLIILGRRYAAMGKMEMAKTLLEQSVRLFPQTKIKDLKQAEKLSVLLSKFQAQLGQVDVAWATSSSNRAALIPEKLKLQSPQAVLSLAKKITDLQAKAQALGAVAIAFAQQGQPDQGRKILEQAIRSSPLDNVNYSYDLDHLLPAKSGLSPRKSTIDLYRVFPLIASYAKTGQMVSALEIAQGTGSKALVLAIKAVIANEYARTGDPRAQAMMSEVKTQMAQASQNDTYPVLRQVFAELMANHQYQFVWEMTKTIDAKTWEKYLIESYPVDPLSSHFLAQIDGWQSDIMRAAIADKRYDIALEVARRDYRLFKHSTPTFVDAGLVDEALIAARQVEPEHRADVLSSIALKLEQQGDLTQAKSIWTEALSAAQQLPEGKSRAKALIEVATKLPDTTHQIQVDEILQQIITIDKSYWSNEDYKWNPVLQSIVESLLMARNPNLAIRLVEAMPPNSPRELHQVLLFQNLLSFFDEYIPESEIVLAKIPRSAIKVRSQIALADAYFTWGAMQKSSETLKQAQADLQQIPEAEIIKAVSQAWIGHTLPKNITSWLTGLDNRSSLLGYIALGHTKMKDYHLAAQILQVIPDLQIRDQWRSHLACYSDSPLRIISP